MSPRKMAPPIYPHPSFDCCFLFSGRASNHVAWNHGTIHKTMNMLRGFLHVGMAIALFIFLDQRHYTCKSDKNGGKNAPQTTGSKRRKDKTCARLFCLPPQVYDRAGGLSAAAGADPLLGHCRVPLYRVSPKRWVF